MSADNKSETSFFSKFMIWTGAIILTFFILHLFNFYFIKLGIVKGNPEDFYSIAHNLFKIPAYDYHLSYMFCTSWLSSLSCFLFSISDTGSESQDLDSCCKVVALDICNAYPCRICYYIQSHYGFSDKYEKEKNINHGKINFKDTRWSAGKEMDEL